MKKFSKLKVFDCFAIPLSLKYKRLSYYRTWMGVFLTLSLFSLTAVFLKSSSQDLFERSNPIVSKSDIQIEDPNFFPLKNYDFPVMVGISDFDTATFFQDERIYKAKAELITFQKYNNTLEKNITVETVPLLPCTYEFIQNISIPDYFFQQKWNSLYCLHINQNSNLEIGGAFVQNSFKFLRVFFEYCVNTTNESNCLPQEEIDNKLNRGYSSLFFLNYVENFKNLETPMSFYGQNLFTNIGINYTKGIDVNFKEVIIESDPGIILSNITQVHYRVYDDSKEFYEPHRTNRFFYYEFKMGFKKQIYNRNYIKIQEILSKTGGLINILYLLCSLILLPFTKLKLYSDILKNCYDFKAFNNKKTDNNKNSKKLKFSICDYFKLFFSKIVCLKYNSHISLIRTGIKSVEDSLDIRNILKKLQEIDKLKLLLLNNEQLTLFNNLPKPKLSENNAFKIGDLSFSKRKDDYFNVFHKLKRKQGKLGDFVLKLLCMIDEKFKIDSSKKSITRISQFKSSKSSKIYSNRLKINFKNNKFGIF